MTIALANMTVKAWEARTASLSQLQLSVQTPQFVSRMQRTLASYGKGRATGAPPAGPARPASPVHAADSGFDWFSQQDGGGLGRSGIDGGFMGDFMQHDQSTEWGMFDSLMGLGDVHGLGNT